MQSSGKSQPESPQEKLELAAALHKQGDFRGAAEHYRDLLEHLPGHPQILNMFGLAAAELGDFSEAVEAFEKAVKSTPDYAEAWINLGLVQQKAGNLEDAASTYDRLRTLDPKSPAGHTNFANVCQLLKRFDEAVAAYEKALALAPDNPALWGNASRAYLHTGDWEKSVKAADRTLTLSPGNTGALAIKSAALLELDRGEELANLVDFDRLIATREFAAPNGYAGLKDFNEALCAHCLAHPSLVYEPSDNTTLKGHQTGNLSKDANQGPIAHLLALIDDAVRDYQTAHPADPSHPFLAQRPTRWKHDIWATVLGSQGHQAPHIHRSGWLSGCYYAKIPDVISADAKTQAGWIEFGRPQENAKAKEEPVVRSYRPHEGMVVLFPSYFYHRTEPFESEDTRISIAFDILPVS